MKKRVLVLLLALPACHHKGDHGGDHDGGPHRGHWDGGPHAGGHRGRAPAAGSAAPAST